MAVVTIKIVADILDTDRKVIAQSFVIKTNFCVETEQRLETQRHDARFVCGRSMARMLLFSFSLQPRARAGERLGRRMPIRGFRPCYVSHHPVQSLRIGCEAPPLPSPQPFR